MTQENIVSKVQKLLRLSQSNNSPEEAASAAAKAQELIDQHNLSAAMLALDGATPVDSPDEPIVNFTDSPLHVAPSLIRWRGQLAMSIAKWNGCKIWRTRGNLMIIGRPSDAETVRYLFAWLEREVERLAVTFGNGQGKTWRNNFRLGVVETIEAKLEAQHKTFSDAAQRAAANPLALVRVNQALANVEERRTSVERWTKNNMKLRRGTAHRTWFNSGAREAGRAAGQSITIGGAKRALVNPRGLKA